jgi:hypothetical protein
LASLKWWADRVTPGSQRISVASSRSTGLRTIDELTWKEQLSGGSDSALQDSLAAADNGARIPKAGEEFRENGIVSLIGCGENSVSRTIVGDDSNDGGERMGL